VGVIPFRHTRRHPPFKSTRRLLNVECSLTQACLWTLLGAWHIKGRLASLMPLKSTITSGSVAPSISKFLSDNFHSSDCVSSSRSRRQPSLPAQRSEYDIKQTYSVYVDFISGEGGGQCCSEAGESPEKGQSCESKPHCMSVFLVPMASTNMLDSVNYARLGYFFFIAGLETGAFVFQASCPRP